MEKYLDIKNSEELLYIILKFKKIDINDETIEYIEYLKDFLKDIKEVTLNLNDGEVFGYITNENKLVSIDINNNKYYQYKREQKLNRIIKQI